MEDNLVLLQKGYIYNYGGYGLNSQIASTKSITGSESIDNLRGIYADILVLDEKAFMGTNIDAVIVPFMTDRKGKVIQISSVRGRNQFYKDYIKYKQFIPLYL